MGFHDGAIPDNLCQKNDPIKGKFEGAKPLGGVPPESPFTKGGEFLPFLKGEQEGFK